METERETQPFLALPLPFCQETDALWVAASLLQAALYTDREKKLKLQYTNP